MGHRGFSCFFLIEKIYKSDIIVQYGIYKCVHLLLGRHWQFDVDVVRKGKDNMYEFW